MNEIIKQDEMTARVAELIARHQKGDEQAEWTQHLAALIAARVQQGIDDLVIGKIVVTPEELRKIYKPISDALYYLDCVMFRTASQRLEEHGFHRQANDKWRRPAAAARSDA
jgi:hypothetical protein